MCNVGEVMCGGYYKYTENDGHEFYVRGIADLDMKAEVEFLYGTSSTFYVFKKELRHITDEEFKNMCKIYGLHGVEKEQVTAPSVLEKAAQHMKDRAGTYDSPDGERSMKATVEAFNNITGHKLKEAEGWVFMTLLKLVRAYQREQYHADSFEDAAAYVGLAAESKAQEKTKGI